MPEKQRRTGRFSQLALYSSVVLAAFLVGQQTIHANEAAPETEEVQPTANHAVETANQPITSSADPNLTSAEVSEEASETDQIPSLDVNLEEVSSDETAREFEEAEVHKLENTSLNASNKRLELAPEVRDRIKESESGTIYLEYKAQANGFFNLFATSSQTHANEYTALFVNNGVVGLESRIGSGGQTSINLNTGSQRALNGEWNAVALTYQKKADSDAVDVKIYVNGKESQAGVTTHALFRAASQLNMAQLGEVKRASRSVWAATSLDIRNFTHYDRAFTEEEIQRRSALFIRREHPYVHNEESRLSEKITVFEGGRNNQKNPANGVASFRIPALLKTDKGTLIAATDQRHDHHLDYGNIAQVVKRSLDNGQTWSETITIVDLKDNPQARDRNFGAPMTIDTALIQDPTTKRIFALYDMFPEGKAVMDRSKLTGRKAEHSLIDGKYYLNLYSATETAPYTVRENGVVYSPEGQATNYRVNVNDKSPGYANLGDLYEGDNPTPIGNIYYQTETTVPFKVTMDNYIWMSYSDDDGLTWSTPVDLTATVKKEYMMFLGIGPGTGIVLHTGPHKGRLIVPAYGINYTATLNSQSALVLYSDDHGATWKSGQTFNDNRTLANGTVIHSETMNNWGEIGTEATVVQLSNGDIKMFMRGQAKKIRVATSKDGGVTWQSDLEVLDEVPDPYVQLSAIRIVRDNKEYILLSNANGPGTQRMDGHIRVAEVGADGSLTWLKHQIIQDGEFAYNSIQDLGNDEFGLLYEHKTGDQNWYSLYYKTFNWNYLMQKDYGLPESRVTAVEHYQDGYVTLAFNNTVLAVNRPNLLLSNGHHMEFVSQLEANKLLYRLDPADKSEVIVGLSSGELVNVSKLPVNVLAFLDTHPRKLIQKVNGKKVRITGEDVFEEARGNGLANLMDGNKGSLTELKWLVAGQPSVSLPQTITLTLPEEKRLHSMVITKRTPGNGTMTKYRVKAFLGEQVQFDSGEQSVEFATAEIAFRFNQGVQADRVEFIPLEAHTNATTKDNRMWTVREVQLFEMVDIPEEKPQVAMRSEFHDSTTGVLLQLEEEVPADYRLSVQEISSSHSSLTGKEHKVYSIQLLSASDEAIILTAPALLLLPKAGDKLPLQALLLRENNAVTELDLTESPVTIAGQQTERILVLTEQLGQVALVYPLSRPESRPEVIGGVEQPADPISSSEVSEEIVTAKGASVTHELAMFDGGISLNENLLHELPAFDGGISLNENLTHALPVFDGGLVPADLVSHHLPILDPSLLQVAGEKQVSQPAASKPVVQEKAKTLPNTGADLGLVWTLAGIGVLGSLVERRKRLG